MTIKGVEGLTVGDVQEQVRQGAKFVVFGYRSWRVSGPVSLRKAYRPCR